MKVFLLDRLTDGAPLAVVRGGRVMRYLQSLSAFCVAALLVGAFGWLWLRGRTRPVAREFLAKGRLYGSVLEYLWVVALRVVMALPWLMLGIVALGLVLGLAWGGLRWWWLGPPAALLGASLAPAWADTVVRWGRR